DLEAVQGLLTLAVGPPELRPRDRDGRAGAGGHGPAAQREAPAASRAGVGALELVRKRKRDGPAGRVGLRHGDRGKAVAAPALKADVAPYAGGHEARAPVPPELALLLAQHRAAADRVAELARAVGGPVGADAAGRAPKAHAQPVAPAAQQRP